MFYNRLTQMRQYHAAYYAFDLLHAVFEVQYQNRWAAPTGSGQYVFPDPNTMKGAIVDPVLDFDPLAGATSTANAERTVA